MRKLFLFISILSTCFLHAQKISGEKISKWKGFEKVSFQLDSFSAYYIKPEKPAEGNPWVWRAYFPNWHTGIDRILLSCRFYIAYINTSDLYGRAKAMLAWDQLYDYPTSLKHFASKVALEGECLPAIILLVRAFATTWIARKTRVIFMGRLPCFGVAMRGCGNSTGEP